MTPEAHLDIPPKLYRSAKTLQQPERARASALWLLDHMCQHLELRDFADVELLDFGCGVKFSEALISSGRPINRYVGVDVHREMIQFLRDEVHDPRFEYFHIDAHNELYNPDGQVLSDDTPLPIDGRVFDVICLFSVFTHLAPPDYRTLLTILRRYAKPTTRLFYSLFVDELTPGGHGLADAWHAQGDRVTAELVADQARHDPVLWRPGTVETFKDASPTAPLRWAVYSERHARELIDGTGWRPLSLSPPDVHLQHHFVCAPC